MDLRQHWFISHPSSTSRNSPSSGFYFFKPGLSKVFLITSKCCLPILSLLCIELVRITDIVSCDPHVTYIMRLSAVKTSLVSLTRRWLLDLHVSTSQRIKHLAFPFYFLFSCGILHLCVCEFKLLYRRVYLICRLLEWLEKLLWRPFYHSPIKMTKREDLRWFPNSKLKNLRENQSVGHRHYWRHFSWCYLSMALCCCPPQQRFCWTLAPLCCFALSSVFIRLSMGFVKTFSSKGCQNQWKGFWHSLKTKGSLF